MDDFKEQYRQELIYQEIKSNKHTLKGFLCFFIAVAFIWLLTMVGFFEVDKSLITISFVSTAVLFTPLLCIYLKSDLSKPWLKYFILTLICIVSAVIITFLSIHAVLLYVVPLLFAIQYRKRSTLWFVYAVNTVTMLISSLTSFYYGICDLNILLESRHTRNWYLDIITETSLNIPFNENPVFVIIVFEVLPRSIILLVFTIMLQYIIVSSNEDAYRIADLTYRKETDLETRLFNKNKYEEMVTDYYPKIDKIAAIFWDVNNLKEINDKHGHAIGDSLIEKMSSGLYAQSDKRCRVYRIGGDEFLMIIDNPNKGETESKVKSVKEVLNNSSIGDGIKVSSAVGMAEGTGRDILRVVKAADARMYEDKKQSKEGRQ